MTEQETPVIGEAVVAALLPKKPGRPPGSPNKPKMFEGGREASTGMPKRIEALMILLTDSNKGGVYTALNMVDLDSNPATKSLPLKEKKLILQHWPTWAEYCDKVEDYKHHRAGVLRSVKNADNAVGKLKRKLNLNAMRLSEQLKASSQVFGDEVIEASIRLAKTDAEMALADPASLALYKHRVQHVKDMLAITRQLHDLSARHESAEATSNTSYALSEETEALLAKARSVIPGFEDDGS